VNAARRAGLLAVALLALASLAPRAPAAPMPIAQAPQSAPRAAPVVPRGDSVVAEILAPLEDANARLARQLVGPDDLGARLAAARAQIAALDDRLADLRADRARSEAHVAAAGGTESVGLLLWRQRAELPPEAALAESLRRRQSELNELQVRLLDSDEQAEALADPEARVTEQTELLPSGLTPRQQQDAVAGIRALLAERRALLAEIHATGRQTFDALLDVEARERALAAETSAFREYVTEHVLWLRSATPLDEVSLPGALADGWDALRWLCHPRHWTGLLAALVEDARSRPWIAASCLLLVGLLVRLRWPARDRIRRAAERVSRNATDSFGATLDALLSSALLALAWPTVWWLLSWRLSASAQGGDFEHAVGAGLRLVARQALGLAFVHKLCRPAGLGEAHFRWPPEVARALRWTVRLLALVWLPAIFITAVMGSHRNDGWEESLGRAAFVLSGVAMALIVQRALRSEGRIMRSVGEGEREGLAWKLRGLWRTALVLLPLAFAALALAGYYYTALVLQGRLQSTLWLCVALSVLYALLLRWMTVARRQLLLAAKRARRQASDLAAEAEGAGREAPTVAALAAEAAEDGRLDLALVDDQTRRLLRAVLGLLLLVGAWSVWADVLPAFEVLNRVTLWRHATGGSESMPMVDASGRALLDAAGAPQLGVAPVQQSVTLVNLLAALLALAMGAIAARNVPGLLELALLRRLPIGPAGRYATKSLARYVIVVAGIIAVFGALGVAWNDVQWLAAAVTVGLGFGLQEIFANFVAGVILLLERPIRIGDTVTVGGVTGDVSRIRMRATTITDWNRRELLVPNKEFITGQVVNWTLSDSVLRDSIKVGVAYGSDTRRVVELLGQIARRESLVLDDPGPSVLFAELGESTLNFELRVFVASPADFRAVRHHLNLAIEAAFRAEGIDIAFPQRDIHIRSVPPEWGPMGGGAAAARQAGPDAPPEPPRAAP